MELVVLDKEGSRIHCFIRSVYYRLFEPILEEGKVFVVANLTMDSNTKKYRPTKHIMQIIFKRDTLVSSADDLDIPIESFDFVATKEILSSVRDDLFLIGMLFDVLIVPPTYSSSSCKLLERKKETGVGNELRGKEEGRFAGVEREGSSQCRRRPHRVAPPRQSTRPCHRREPPCRRHHEAADLVRVRERSERGGGQRSRRARHCADSSREELVPSPIILAQHQRQNRDLKRARAITTDGEGGASAEKVKSPLSPAPPSRVTAERAVTSAVASLVCSAVVPLRRRPSSHTEQERQRDLRLSWGFNHHAQPCLRRRRRLGWNCRRQKRVQAAANGASRNCSKVLPLI
ncbi:hypothetical protein Ahy_B03g064038 [Arachis hypogaea]|uniref:Replication protein A 70 kDa DNA-binding subunit B/D first OB fold domain-containing protein n=1 Tax=Arachis hypogaea TaxID=3818 RepID=A0A444ZYM6_ARAHY|nr:hypothetical protein Ahy_B03g064038 [Arachis hypogaea]